MIEHTQSTPPFSIGHPQHSVISRSATEAGHFLVLPEYKTILFAGSPLECSWTQLHHYLQRFSPEDEILHFLPILDKENIKKLDQMKLRKKVTLKVARPDRWSRKNSALLLRSISNEHSILSGVVSKINMKNTAAMYMYLIFFMVASTLKSNNAR